MSVRDLVGKTVEGYSLVEVLGEGADGIVYRAQSLGGDVALKLFFPEALEKNGRAEAKERLELQLALAGKKHHPNLVQIGEGGEVASLNTFYLAMELVPGTSLDRLVGRVPKDCVPGLLAQLAGAARYLETQFGLYHRDIKPANIMVSHDLQHLTLLDLGIVHKHADEQDERLSGMEFVATVRYSPPEFVWREESADASAWQAITFYQIGATLYDMLCGTVLFAGMDTPRVRLYDAVRDHSPTVPMEGNEAWLVQLAHACLLKDWRKRVRFVTWDSFDGPPTFPDVARQERAILLMQARMEEGLLAQARQQPKESARTRDQDLWTLNSSLFGEARNYILGSPIFPRFRTRETRQSDSDYVSEFLFEPDDKKGIERAWSFRIRLCISELASEATDLSCKVMSGDDVLADLVWTEMFNVESSFAYCQGALLDAVQRLISRQHSGA